MTSFHRRSRAGSAGNGKPTRLQNPGTARSTSLRGVGRKEIRANPSPRFPTKPALNRAATKRTSTIFNMKTQKLAKCGRSASPSTRYRDCISAMNDLTVSPIGEAENILAAYRNLRKSVPIHHFPHPEEILDLASNLLPKDAIITHADVQALIGGYSNVNRDAFQYICAACGQVAQQTRTLKYVKVNPLAEEIKERFGHLPNTALDLENERCFASPQLRACLRLAKIKDQAVRMTAGCALYILAAREASAFVQKSLVGSYVYLGRVIASRQNLGEDAAEARTSAITAILADGNIPLKTRNIHRLRFRTSVRLVEDHLAKHGLASNLKAQYHFELPEICNVLLVKKKPRSHASAIARLDSYLATSQEQPEEILAKYRLLRAKIKSNPPPHPPRVIELAAQAIRKMTFSKRSLHSLVGGSQRDLVEVYAELAQRLRQVPNAKIKLDYRPDNPLGPWLLHHLGSLPESQLDPLYAQIIEAPPLRMAIRAFALKIPAVRILAGVSLYLSAAQGRRSDFFQQLAAFRMLEDKLIEAGAEPDTVIDEIGMASTVNPQNISIEIAHAAFKAILADDTLTPHTRVQRYKTIKQHMARLDRFCVTYPQFALRYQPWRIAAPYGVDRLHFKRLMHLAKAEREKRREKSCAPTAVDPGATYRAYETRFHEVELIRNAFDAQCELLRDGKIQLEREESRFSVTIPRTRADGSMMVGGCTLDFALVTRKSLSRRVPSLGMRWLGGDSLETLYLEYLGPRDPEDRLKMLRDGTPAQGPCEPPVLAMYRSGCFFAPQHSSAKQLSEREALLPRASWSHKPSASSQFRFGNKTKSKVAGRCLRAGIVLVPIEEMHFAFAAGRAVGRSVLRGARLGEVLQQVGHPEAFEPSGTKDDVVWTYHAIAKKKTVPEEFYLSPLDMEAILYVMRVTGRNGWKPVIVKPAKTLRSKCAPAVYLYQRRGTAVDHYDISLTVALPLWPHSQRSHDLRHGIARNHRHNGMSRDEISVFLHHGSATRTDGGQRTTLLPVDNYIRPVPQMLAELLNLLDTYYRQEDGE